MWQALYQVLYVYNLIESFLPFHRIGTMIVSFLKMHKLRFSDVNTASEGARSQVSGSEPI